MMALITSDEGALSVQATEKDDPIGGVTGAPQRACRYVHT